MPIQTWLTSSLVQHFPGTPPPAPAPLTLHAALNERMSFQVGVRAIDVHQKVTVEVQAPAGWSVRVRRVGYVPLWHRNAIRNPEGDGHLPGLYPDPLFDESSCVATANETLSFLITLKPGPRAVPGRHAVEVRVSPETGKPVVRRASVVLYGLRVKPRRDFRVTNWFVADGVMNAYGCRGYDERFWKIVPAYFRNMADHGQDMLSTPLLNWSQHQPTQLLRVRRAGKGYQFDFSLVKRWVDAARGAGIVYFEWMDLLTVWNAAFAARVFEGDPAQNRLLWRTRADPTTPHYKKYAQQIGTVDCPDATGPESRDFFCQLLPALHRFLVAEKLLDKSYFHIGDEPELDNIENYRKSRQMFRELAPWMKTIDAYCWPEYSEPGLMDAGVPRTKLVPAILARGQSTWAYYCGNPGATSINRLMDTPLAQVRMNGWLFYRFPIDGFLLWSYNFWYRVEKGKFVPADPFANFDTFNWPHNAYGDCWSVYPGPDGPIDTLRWEAFADSLQDYALLQTLDTPRDGRLLRAIEGYDRFPIDAKWIDHARRLLLTRRST